MTRENRPAVFNALSRAASLLIGAFILAGLPGCADVTAFMGETADASLTKKTKPTLAFVGASGVPQQYAAKVNDLYIAAARAKGVQLIDMKEADYVVKPTFVAGIDAKKGTKLSYALDITDKTGVEVRRLEGEQNVSDKRGSDSWAHVSEDALTDMTQRSIADLSAFIDNPVAVPVAVASAPTAQTPGVKKPAPKLAATHPIAPKTMPTGGTLSAAVVTPDLVKAATAQKAQATPSNELATLMPIVTMAPGDGRTVLAEAMKRALVQQGIKIAAKTDHAYKVQGQVELSSAEGGAQSVTIRWVVIDPAGKQMEKTVIQKNKVDQGRLDKNWGDIADQAAGAAAIEISKLMTTNLPNGQAQQGHAAGSAG